MNITHSKSVVLDGCTLSLSFTDGRISLYRWHGDDYESITFGGTMEDYDEFWDSDVEHWFELAYHIITRGEL